MRNKWKTSYDQKMEFLLGMSRQKAVCQLERQLLLHFGKKLGYGNCYHCEMPIQDSETLSVEHVNPWGGNNAKGLDPCVDNFWDMENLRLSHKRCNCSAANGGTGKFKYIGVHCIRDRRQTPPKEYARAMISIDSDNITLGCYPMDEPEKAAIAYDLAMVAAFKGVGKLNFPELREDYTKTLNNYDVEDNSFWNIRKGPIKKILVDKFYNIIKKDN